MTSEKNGRKGSIWAEFYIEFLGSLVPGLFALILSLIALGLSLFVLCRSLQPGSGLDHLAEWVPWQGKKPETWKYRTKMFINQIKIRLQYLVPERCKDIVRNEAHVRLATSVWYSTRWIMGLCVLGIIMLASALVRIPTTGFDHLLSSAICANVLILAFAIYLKRQIENFIHYLRVREIVYVLETAHFATLNGIDLHREDFDPRRKGETADQAVEETH